MIVYLDDWEYTPNPGTVGGAHAVSSDEVKLSVVDQIRAVCTEVTGVDHSRRTQHFGFIPHQSFAAKVDPRRFA